MFQTFSGGTPYRGKVGEAATPVPNIFRTFPNISEQLRGGGDYHPGGEALTKRVGGRAGGLLPGKASKSQ